MSEMKPTQALPAGGKKCQSYRDMGGTVLQEAYLSGADLSECDYTWADFNAANSAANRKGPWR